MKDLSGPTIPRREDRRDLVSIIPDVEPSESDPHYFESGTRSYTPVNLGPGEPDLKEEGSEPLSLLQSSDVEVRQSPKASKKYVSFATSVARKQRL